ncbi:LamG-like jellyroll fold domain-containing protein [Flammeovirga sp. SJP92]|uniref:LamG-like jellyroll fold domain-containing protein n=1 Tax=Flammeovirga sp. SJP92 TaxID=1775430 RepID=UPI00078726AA|nr:LamG-like jellyroll fold domain-containing protein [Flammeovirga sp. SJP92]KXX66812.1 hypothetical protein AVL50_30225 [Flammeovirga sp. SJP92]
MKFLQNILWVVMSLIPLVGIAQNDPLAQLLFDQAIPTNIGTKTDIVFSDAGGFTYEQSDQTRASFASVDSKSQGIFFKTSTGANYPVTKGDLPRTYSFWVRPKVFSGTQNFIYTGSGAGTTFTLQLTSQGKVKLADNGGNWVAAQTLLELNEWNHVTVALQQSVGIHDVEFYINGDLSEVGISGANNTINTNTGVFKIFATLNADVADFRYYDQYLNASEVFNIYGQKELLLDVVTNANTLSDASENNYSISTASSDLSIGFEDLELGKVLFTNGVTVSATSFRGIEGSTPRTIMFWYKQKEGAGVTDRLTYYGSEKNKFDLQIRDNSSFRLYNFYSADKGGSFLAVEEPIDFTSWRHIVVTTSGATTSDVKIYVDGEEKSIDLSNLTETSINTIIAGDYRISNAAQGYFSDYKVYKGALSAQEITDVFNAVKFNQIITFEELIPLNTKTKTVELSAVASSQLEVTFESSNPSVATVNGTTLTIVGAGETNITATQSGNDRYNAASEVVRKLIVTEYIPATNALLDFAFDEAAGSEDFVNSGVLSDVILKKNTEGGASINIGILDTDKGQVLDINMAQGTGSLIFKEADGSNYTGVTGTGARTYSAWIKPTDLSEFNTIFYAGIDEEEATSISIQLLPTGSIKLVAGGNIVTTEEYQFTENQWNHIVISIPKEAMLSDIKMYINGETAQFDVSNDNLLNTAPATFAIANKFWGAFSDFKYYERAVSEEEALSLYTSTVFTHSINFDLPISIAERESVALKISTSSGLDFDYSISDPSKVKIEDGILTALEEGEVTIEATSFGVTSSYMMTITPYIPEEKPLLDFALNSSEELINTGLRSEVSLVANTENGASILLGVEDPDKGPVLDINMEQGTGSLLFREAGESYAGVTGIGARTYSAWIKPTDLSVFNTIFFAGKTEGEATTLSVQILPTGSVKLVAGGNIITTEEYQFTENQWNHIVISIPKEAMLSDIKMYINGEAAQFDVSNDNVLNTAPATFAIANKFWGSFSDFKYYERAVSEEEALNLYSSTEFKHTIIFDMPSLLNVGERVRVNAFTTSNLPVSYTISNTDVAILSDGILTGISVGEVEVTAFSFGVEEKFGISVVEEEVAGPSEEPLLWFAFDEVADQVDFINKGVLNNIVLNSITEEGAMVTPGVIDEERGNVLFASIPSGKGHLIFKDGTANYHGVTGMNARTYSMWIKPTDLSEQKTIMYQGITIEEEETTNISLQILPTGQVKFVSGGNIVTATTHLIQQDQWNLLQIVIEENTPLEEVKIYINTNLMSTTLTGVNSIVNTGPATFTLANKYKGYYSDFRLYDRALTDTEIKAFISRKDQEIKFKTIENKVYGDPDFMLEASSSSGLEVHFSSSDEGIIQIEGNVAKIVGYGEVSITAAQLGDLKYNPAKSVTNSFVVEKGNYVEQTELQLDFRFDEPADLPGDPYDYSEFHRKAVMRGVYEKGHKDQEKGNVILFNVGTLEVDNYKGILGSQKRSMATWFKANDTKQSVLTSYGIAGEGQFNILYRANNKIRVVLYYNTYDDENGAPVYEFSYVETQESFDFVSDWHHVAVVTEGESIHDIKIYIDGKQRPVLVSPWEGHEKINTQSGGNFKVASNSDVKMSHYKWYTGALSEDEVMAIFKGDDFIGEEDIIVEDREFEGGFRIAFIEMTDFFNINNQGVVYNVTSSNTNVVKVQVEGSLLVLNEVGEGTSEITVELYSGSYELLEVQSFKVTVTGPSTQVPNDLFSFEELPDFFRKERNKPLLTFPTVSTVKVADFGAFPDDGRDDYKAINDALKLAVSIANEENPVRVKFGKGTYDLLSVNENATYLFFLANLSNIIIDGTGTKINIKTPTVGFISLFNAQNVVVQGFEVDYETLPFTQGKVISIADDHIEMKIDEGFPALNENFMMNATNSWGYIKDEKGFMKQGVANLIKTDPNGWNDLGDRVFSLQMSPSQIENFEVGDYFVQLARNNGRTITRTNQCKDVTFLNLTAYASPAGTFSMANNEEVNVIHCNVLLKEGRVHSTNADGMHVVGAKIGPWMQGCIFEGYADDAVNMKHAKSNIIEAVSSTELKVNSLLEVGSNVVVFNPREGKVIQRAMVQSIADNDDKTYNIILSEAVNIQKVGTHQSADHLYNEDVATESFVFRDNIFRNARRYGMLIQSAYGVIENNIFEDLSTGGLVMENGVDWGEGFLAHDILIQNNTFTNCGYDKTYINDEYAATIKMMVMKLKKEDCDENDKWCGKTPADCDEQGIKNIWIKNNTMTYNKVGIVANCVEAGSIIDNQLMHNENDPTLEEGEKGKAMDILNSDFIFEEIVAIENEFMNADWEVSPSKKGIDVLYKGTGNPVASLTLFDGTGRVHHTASIQQRSTKISVSIYKKQLYIIRLVDQDGNIFTKKLMYD